MVFGGCEEALRRAPMMPRNTHNRCVELLQMDKSTSMGSTSGSFGLRDISPETPRCNITVMFGGFEGAFNQAQAPRGSPSESCTPDDPRNPGKNSQTETTLLGEALES